MMAVPPQREYSTRLFAHCIQLQAKRTGVAGRDLYRTLPANVRGAYSLSDFFRFAAAQPKNMEKSVPDNLSQAVFGVYARIPGLLIPVAQKENLELRPFNDQEVFFVDLHVARQQIAGQAGGLTRRELMKVLGEVGEETGAGTEIADDYACGRRIGGIEEMKMKRRHVRAVLAGLSQHPDPG